jgi:hypothetical protein
MSETPTHETESPESPTRYRCTACGNLTRFDVTMTRQTRSFHHYTVGGDLSIEETEVLVEDLESVVCRWCGPGAAVVEITAEAAAQAADSPTDNA